MYTPVNPSIKVGFRRGRVKIIYDYTIYLNASSRIFLFLDTDSNNSVDFLLDNFCVDKTYMLSFVFFFFFFCFFFVFFFVFVFFCSLRSVEPPFDLKVHFRGKFWINLEYRIYPKSLLFTLCFSSASPFYCL